MILRILILVLGITVALILNFPAADKAKWNTKITNTPVIIKYPFWQRTAENENAVYACVNYGEAFCPEYISKRSICIDGDIGDVLIALKK